MPQNCTSAIPPRGSDSRYSGKPHDFNARRFLGSPYRKANATLVIGHPCCTPVVCMVIHPISRYKFHRLPTTSLQFRPNPVAPDCFVLKDKGLRSEAPQQSGVTNSTCGFISLM